MGFPTYSDTLLQGGRFEEPTRVPGGGRGTSHLADPGRGSGGQGRGMGRGPVMPPPGVPVDKWQQPGPMAPKPGQPSLSSSQCTCLAYLGMSFSMKGKEGILSSLPLQPCSYACRENEGSLRL